MNPAPPQTKAELRRRMRFELKGLDERHRLAASAEACSRLQNERLWREAKQVLLYWPLPDELDLRPVLRDALATGKMLMLPRYEPALGAYAPARVKDPDLDLVPGPYGTREPGPGCPAWPLNRLDFVVAPGLAFTIDGRRLGRGKGYYDRMLAAVEGETCGAAFDEQLVEDLPVDPHDIRVKWILTPTRWAPAGRRAG